MGLFQHFPFTNLHELNLDWLIKAVKEQGEHAVLSVNGETGDVVLYKSENIVFPEVTANTWRMVRTADGHTAGIMFQNGLLYVMYDDAAERVYTVDHPPAYPVTSVNGQTGAVETYKTAYNRLPAVSEQNTNFYRQIDKDGTNPVDVGIQVDKNKIERMNGTNRYKVYDEGNTPDIVTSINGESGAVMIAIPFADTETENVMFQDAATGHTWSLGRETIDGVASIQLETSANGAEVYVRFFTENNPPVSYVRKLLTVDDIPSSSGVVSVNGLTGVVTLYGNTMPIVQGGTNVKAYIDTAIAGVAETLPNSFVYIVDGDTASAAVPAGAYVYIKNNTHSLADGFYQNTSNAAFPVSGGTADNTVFTAVGAEGVINSLNDRITGSVVHVDIDTIISDLDSIPLNTFGRVRMAAAVNPTGTSTLDFNYICLGIAEYRTVILSSTYSDLEWINTKHVNTWRGWREMAGREQNIRAVTYQYSVNANSRVNTNLATLIDADMPAGGIFGGIAGFQSGDANTVISACFYANNNYSLCINNFSGNSVFDKTATIYYHYI